MCARRHAILLVLSCQNLWPRTAQLSRKNCYSRVHNCFDYAAKVSLFILVQMFCSITPLKMFFSEAIWTWHSFSFLLRLFCVSILFTSFSFIKASKYISGQLNFNVLLLKVNCFSLCYDTNRKLFVWENTVSWWFQIFCYNLKCIKDPKTENKSKDTPHSFDFMLIHNIIFALNKWKIPEIFESFNLEVSLNLILFSQLIIINLNLNESTAQAQLEQEAAAHAH